MPTPTTHTPTPWHIAITGGQTTAGCPLVGIIPELRTIQHDRATYLHPVDAQHIVHCVNTHAALVAALEGLYEHCVMVHKYWGENSNSKEADAAIKAGQDALAQERSAP